MKRLICAALALSAVSEPALAKVTWRGSMCITAVSSSCPAGDWQLTCYNMAYRPPNVSDNGPSTRFAFGDGNFRYGMGLASGSLIGTTYRAVSQTSVTTFGYSPQNVTMRFTTHNPTTLTTTSPTVYIVGNINNTDGHAGCNLTFRATGVLAPN